MTFQPAILSHRHWALRSSETNVGLDLYQIWVSGFSKLLDGFKQSGPLLANEANFFDPHFASVAVYFGNDVIPEKLQLCQKACVLDRDSEKALVVVDRPGGLSDARSNDVTPLLLETVAQKSLRDRQLAIFKESL